MVFQTANQVTVAISTQAFALLSFAISSQFKLHKISTLIYKTKKN